MFEGMIALLEVNVAALVRTQQSDFLLRGDKNSLLVIARYSITKRFFPLSWIMDLFS